MISIPSLVFYALAAVLILSAVAVVTCRNVFRAALALVLALSVVGGLFLLLGADFLGASQILVYVGGVMIIMLFVVMFSQQPLDALQRQSNDQRLPGFILAVLVGASLVISFQVFKGVLSPQTEMLPTTASIGRLLLGDLILPFEAVSLVLLAALVGAVLFSLDTQEPLSK